MFDNNVNDQTVEGAINLMMKCGYAYEQNVMNVNDKQHVEKKENYDKIFDKFNQYVVKENPKIS